jgi:two-component system chemotaxis response regulator CheV
MTTLSAQRNQGGSDRREGNHQVELFEFIVGNVHFAINVAKVQQIIRRDTVTITRIDQAPPSVIGMFHFRGKPTLVVDLNDFLGIGGERPDPGRQPILVTEFNQTTFAFLVDGTTRIHRIGWDQVVPIDQTTLQANAFVSGVFTLTESIVQLLDLESIMCQVCPEKSIEDSAELSVSQDERANRAKIRILYAEDSALVRRKTSEKLRERGFEQITFAENGKRALDILNGWKEEATRTGGTIEDCFDVLLTDIEMPELDGLSLTQHLRSEFGAGNIPVIVYSSLVNDQTRRDCEAAGVTKYLPKPNIDAVIDVCRNLHA